MSAPTDPRCGYAVDRFREECHRDSEGYLHTGSAQATVDSVLIRTTEADTR